MSDSLAAIVAELRARFTSGNSVPVQRAYITRDEYDRLEALSRSGGEWQPIETAPKRKTVLTFAPLDRYVCAFLSENDDGGNSWGWIMIDPCLGDPLNDQPTHWQPLPAPPQAGEGMGEDCSNLDPPEPIV